MADDLGGLETWLAVLGERTRAAQEGATAQARRLEEERARAAQLVAFREEHLAQLRGGGGTPQRVNVLVAAQRYLATVDEALRRQQRRCAAAEQACVAATERLAAAHREQEGIQRLLDTRREEQRAARARQEQRQLDELAQTRRSAVQGGPASGATTRKPGLR